MTSIAAACTASTPGPVVATVAAIEQLGLDCGYAVKDNVPSGLFQWSCAGTIDDDKVTILVDGNDEGVNAINLVLSQPTDVGRTRRLFERLVDTVPPLNTAPVLKTLVADWDGTQVSRTLGGIRAAASCDEFQCGVLVMPADDPLRPLPLP